MEEIEDIKVILRFHSKYKIPADLVARIIAAVDTAIKDAEAADFSAIKKEIPQIPKEIIDAVEQGITKNQFTGMYLESAETGSIIIEGIVVAAASWILLNTIGESFKDAWKESELNQRIKDVLLSKQITKVEELVQRIQNKIEENIALEAEGVNLVFGTAKEEGVNKILVSAEFLHSSFGTRGDLTFKDDDYHEEKVMVSGG